MSLIKAMNEMLRGMTHTCRTVIAENKTLLNQSHYMLGFLSTCRKMFFATKMSYRPEVMTIPVTKGNVHVLSTRNLAFSLFLVQSFKRRKEQTYLTLS